MEEKLVKIGMNLFENKLPLSMAIQISYLSISPIPTGTSFLVLVDNYVC